MRLKVSVIRQFPAATLCNDAVYESRVDVV